MSRTRKFWPALLALTLATAGLCGAQLQTSAQAATVSAADATTLKVVAAANSFLETLTVAQKTKVMFEFGDAAQRVKWSNFPTGIFQRSGVKIGDINTAQQKALFAMLESVLSPAGFKQVSEVIAADEVLKSTDGGGNLTFGRAEYYVSFMGAPSATSPWRLQFGGHHLALNITVVGADIVMTPSLTGGQPTSYTLDGKTVQPLKLETTAAFKLIAALDATQLKQAVIGSQFIDLVLGPGKDGKTLQPEGLKASSLTAAQQTLLLELIQTRVGLLNDNDAAVEMTKIKAGLASTYLAWSGPTASGSAAYYRVTGPRLLIEFSPQSMGGVATNHIHSMLRDPLNDYGAALTK